MDRRQFLDITEGFDNIQYVETPMYMHFWFDENDKIQSKSGTTVARKFGGDTRKGLLKYLEEEHAKGNTVYFYGDPQVIYDPHNFTPSLVFRMNSYDGILKRKAEEIETIIEDNNYKYLLIA
jgi:hypothetical protein